jgi:FkbM family methyltransferase
MHLVAIDEFMAVIGGRDGYFLINRKDVYVGRALEIYGEYNGLEAAFLKRLVMPGDVVVEVGANIGSHTVGLAKAVGAQGKVFAFEPQRACYALLQAQIALNRLSNIVVGYNEAVGRERGRLWVPPVNYDNPGNFGGVALGPQQSPAAQPVDVTTLDERLGDAKCSLIKIDVEGMEEDVIRGGLNTIRKHRPLLYVENDRPDKSPSLVALLLELGYRLWWHMPPLFRKDNFFNVSADAYPNIVSFNMICATEPRPMFSGLQEIASPQQPHPLAPQPTGTR